MPEPRFATLGEWLAWQETLHHSEIELGLERVQAVARSLLDLPPRYPVITVAGTNGKGSVLACLQAMLSAAGYRTGHFTSPHLLRYNERIEIDGRHANDQELMEAFIAVDAARGTTSLTYFEFSTLAALWLFQCNDVEVGLLEVGMGGRLDAVNIIAPDVAVITNIGLDHQAWLGPDREAIGREKAGIMRTQRPVICGDPDPPLSLLAHARETGAQLMLRGRDFDFRVEASGWAFHGPDGWLGELPPPSLPGEAQIGNAALALAALHCLGERLPVAANDIRRGLRAIHLPGRIQVRGKAPQWVLDVCHNPESAEVLADWLGSNPCGGRTRLVLGMLADKNVEEVSRILSGQADHWYLAGLPGRRGLAVDELAKRVCATAAQPVASFASVAEACKQAAEEAGPDDRIVVCGSFHTVGAALALAL